VEGAVGRHPCRWVLLLLTWLVAGAHCRCPGSGVTDTSVCPVSWWRAFEAPNDI